MLIASNLHEDDSLVARERAAGETVFVEKDDNSAIRRLVDEAARYDLQLYGGKRMECYLILDSLTSLWLLQTVGIPRTVSEKVDVFATTVEDLLAKNIFVRLPGIPIMFPSLDRDIISRDCEVRVHLVLIGFYAGKTGCFLITSDRKYVTSYFAFIHQVHTHNPKSNQPEQS